MNQRASAIRAALYTGTTMEKMTHNGWTNYETCAVSGWLSDEESIYCYWRTITQETVKLCKLPEESDEQISFVLADRIRDEILEAMPRNITGVYSDLLQAALHNVNWLELAEIFLRELNTVDDEPDIWNGPRPAIDADPKFSLGQTMATPGALEAISPMEMISALARHHRGDWGDCRIADWRRNEEALREGSRLFSVYHTGDGEKFWIITEHDRSITTVLLPSEY